MWFPENCTLEIGKNMNLLDCQLCIDLKMNTKQIYCMSTSCKFKNGVWRYVTAFVTLRNICTFRSLDMDLVTSYDARRQFFIIYGNILKWMEEIYYYIMISEEYYDFYHNWPCVCLKIHDILNFINISFWHLLRLRILFQMYFQY